MNNPARPQSAPPKLVKPKSASKTQPRPFTGEEDLFYMSGWFFLVLLLCVSIISLGLLVKNGAGVLFGLFLFVAVFLIKGLRIVHPNEAVVATFFGAYAGTFSESGFFFINPLHSVQTVSVKSNNYVTPALKVNDSEGNPIEIAASVVWHVASPAAAVFDVENILEYVKAQSEGAIRELASSHPYDCNNGECLRRQSDSLLEELRVSVQERLSRAGIRVEETRITHLAYAPEIAQAMLRRQQAQAIVAAREIIVDGAVSMVEKTVLKLSEKGVVVLDEKEKARLVTNMLTVLLSDEAASPVVSVGGRD